MRITPTNYYSRINYSSKPKKSVVTDFETSAQKQSEKKSKFKKFALLATGLILTGLAIWKHKEIKGFFNKVSKEIKESPVFQKPSVTEIKQEEKVAEKVSEKATEVLTPDVITIPPKKRPHIKLKENKGQTTIYIDEKGKILGEKKVNKDFKTDNIVDAIDDAIIFDTMANHSSKHSGFDNFFGKFKTDSLDDMFRGFDDFMNGVDDVMGNGIDDLFGHMF